LSQRKSLFLGEASSFAYLRGCTIIDGVDDAAVFEETKRALRTFGIYEEMENHIWCILAAILHLGNVKFTSGKQDEAIVKDRRHVKTVGFVSLVFLSLYFHISLLFLSS